MSIGKTATTTFGELKVSLERSDLAILVLLKGMLRFLDTDHRAFTNVDVIRRLDPYMEFSGNRRNRLDVAAVLREKGVVLIKELLDELTLTL